MLVIARLTPVFTGFCLLFANIPIFVRLMLLLTIGAVVAGTLPSVGLINADAFVMALLIELCIGSIFVFAINIALGAVETVGGVIDTHMGFAAVSVLNPLSSSRASIHGNLFALLVVMIFFILGLHTDLIAFIAESMRFLPLGSSQFFVDADYFLSYLSRAFVLAFMLFIPVFTGLFVVDLIVGLMAKTMPQMNVYFVILPLKIFVGITLVALSLKYSAIGLKEIAESVMKFNYGL